MAIDIGIGGIIGIVLAVLLAIALLVGILAWCCRRNAGEKLPPQDQELREDVMPSFEDAGEAHNRSYVWRKLDPTCIILPRQGGGINHSNTPALHSRAPAHLQSYAATVTNAVQNPADKTGLGRLLTERMSRARKAKPTGPPVDDPLNYGYEGGISDAEEGLQEAGEEEGDLTDLLWLTSASQSRENIGEDGRELDLSREEGTLYQAFDDLHRLPDLVSSPPQPLLSSLPSLPPQPPPPPQQQRQERHNIHS